MKETPAYKHFLIELKRYFQNTIKKEYEPSPAPPFVIGGADIAAVAMAASKTPELTSVTQDMPYLPENKRNETGDNVLKKMNIELQQINLNIQTSVISIVLMAKFMMNIRRGCMQQGHDYSRFTEIQLKSLVN